MNYLEFAIKMELDGEKFYLEQAEKNEGNSLHRVFTMLAEDEKMHAAILKRKFDQSSYELVEQNTPIAYKNVFEGLEDFEDEIKADVDQLDVYRMALEKEKESIELYEKMVDEATDPQDKKLFEFLIEQEQMHYDIIEDVISHLARAEEWVESAEFGLREEY